MERQRRHLHSIDSLQGAAARSILSKEGDLLDVVDREQTRSQCGSVWLFAGAFARLHANADKYVCVAAPFGGPIATMIDETKFVKVTAGVSPSQIQIFTSSGKKKRTASRSSSLLFSSHFLPALVLFLRCCVKPLAATGKKLAAFVLKKSQARLIRLGWTDQEELVAVLDDGHALLYTVFGELIREASSVCMVARRWLKALLRRSS